MDLNLIEALLLISLDDDNGRFITDSGNLRYGISGAILMELALEGKIEVEGENLVLISTEPAESKVVNEILDLLKITSVHGEVKYWVNKIGSKSQEVQNEVLEGLCARKILRKEENKFLWFISYDIFPAEDMAPENEVRRRIIDVVQNGSQPEPKDLMLLSLIEACGLIREVFHDRDEYTVACTKIKELISAEYINQVVGESIQKVMTSVNDSVEKILATTAL